MSEQIDFKAVAAQLRKPEGEMGYQVAAAMNKSNAALNWSAVEALNLNANEKVLEIGMGNGYFVEQLIKSKSGIHYTGYDYSALMVAEASRINSEYITSGHVKIIHAVSNQYPFRNANFHKIFCVNLIYFWDDPSRELKEIRRILNPGGNFVLAIRSKKTMELLPFSKHGFTLYDSKDAVDLLEKHDFQVTAVSKENELQIFADKEVVFENIIIKCI